MDLGSLIVGWLLFGCRRPGGAPGGGYYTPPEPGYPGAPILLPASTPAWPAATPTGLPAFPGSGWEYDEPPPAAVQQRAGQLLSELWGRGSGAFRIEQTGGRFIAYQAQVVASGKKGVVAYRLKRAAALPAQATAARAPARPAPRPAAPRAPAPRAPAPAARAPAAAPPAPRPAAPAAPASSSPRPVATARPTQNTLPELRRGWGIAPAPPHPDVRILQQRLGIAADGRFGAGTEAAVKEFQRRNGLTSAKWPQGDGIVGPKTWTKLFAVRA